VVSLACEPKECILKRQAFVLAAGLGTRLRPITNYVPKPLFPVLNRPILELILEKLLKQFSNIIINTYHLSDQISLFVKNRFPNQNIYLTKEPILLGTGGALKNALSLMDKNLPILIYNSDIITDFDPALLYNFHINISRKQNSIATLLLHNHKEFNNIICDSSNKITAFRVKAKNGLAYTGIMVIEPEFIDLFINNEPCDIIDIFSKALIAGKTILGVEIKSLVNQYIWQDIGTIKGYMNAHKLLLLSKNKKFYIPKDLDIKRHKIILEDWVCIGDNVSFKRDILKPIVIKRSIIWSNSKIPNNLKLIKDMVITNKDILRLT